MTNYRLTPLRDTAKNKERIMEKTRLNMEKSAMEIRKEKRPIAPVLIAVCILVLSFFLAGPYVYQAFFKEQKFTVEKVVFPQSAHSSLYNAIYIDATNEFIYSKEDGFYSFDVVKKQETLVVQASNMTYGYLASEKWIVWNQAVNNQQVLAIWNRETQELKMLDSEVVSLFEIKEDRMLTLTFLSNEEQEGVANYSYTMFDLNTKQHEIIMESTSGSNSKPTIDGNMLVISQTIDTETGEQTILSIRDLETMNELATYMVPYDVVQKLTIKDGSVYGYMWNSNVDESGVIGAIDLEASKMTILKTFIKVDDYATDGQHFAISVQKGDSNSVQLFEEQEGQLKRISALPTIRERLVLPRFTEQGTLVVTSEGPERPIYLIRFN